MTNNIISQLEDTILHKKIVLDSCFLFSEYLYSINKIEIALELLKRASVHDMSKFEEEELNNLASIPLNKDAFKNPNTEMSEEEMRLIQSHWKNNSHHPEHFKDYEEMSELDIIEMVCDWHARSVQFNTDFLEFVKTRQENRFHFKEKQFEKIYDYCKILDNIYKIKTGG